MREIGLPLVLALAALILLASVNRSRRSRRRWETRPRATGTIVDRRSNPAYEISFNVLVEFRTQDGREVRGWSTNVIEIERAPTEGSTVEVAYDPADPERFEARPTTPPRPTSPLMWLLVGVIVVGVGFFLCVSWR